MTTTIEKTRPEDRFVAAFEQNVGHALNGSNARLQGLRQEAFERFTALGFPTPRTEAWKYTNIGAVLAHDYQVQLRPALPALDRAAVDAHRVPGLDAHLAVLVNGRYVDELSDLGGLPDGVIVTGLARANERHTELLNRYLGHYAPHGDEAFTALNTAFTQDGLFVYLPKDAVLERPLHVLHLVDTADDLFLQPRNVFVFEQGSQARLVMHDARHDGQHDAPGGGAKTFANQVDEVYVGRNAHVAWYKVQQPADAAALVASTHVHQEADSVASFHTVTLGGAVVRNNMRVVSGGENAETHLYGLFLPRGTEHVDNHTYLDHARPNCYSHELYKGVLAGRATGVFNGKVYVRRDAQKINAFQENKTIVLSNEARMYTKPELEIYADDVKCSHGATSGQLDADALFYLRSRGLTPGQARAVLLLAFARDVIDSIPLEPVRAWLDGLVTDRFNAQD